MKLRLLRVLGAPLTLCVATLVLLLLAAFLCGALVARCTRVQKPISETFVLAAPVSTLEPRAFLPLVMRQTPLPRNGGFEAGATSHLCLVLPVSGPPYYREVENIFVPDEWTFWFVHQPGVWDQPEGRLATLYVDPRRIHSGNQAYQYFTFCRKHDAGLYQQVQVSPGTRLRLTGWGQAYNDTYNALLSLGIDPTGGVNPLAASVVWGEATPVYSTYVEIAPVEAIAQAATVTVLLRSVTLWPLENNDVYWDDIVLSLN